YAIASASTRLNYHVWLMWRHVPTATLAWTDEAVAQVQRDAFLRFYGLGPDTLADAETSYTGTHLYASERRGLNLGRHVNAGITIDADREGVQADGVRDLPLSPVVFPDVP